MAPLRAESSTVSLPPREHRAAKRKEKARKHQQASLSPTGPIGGAKHKAKQSQQSSKQPVLTLAGQRQRRATEVAYLSRPDGIHIKRVVRRPKAAEPVVAVPYLAGQEDLPHSDAESDSTDSTVPETSKEPTWGEIDLEINAIAEHEAERTSVEFDPELVDYDAEGEDEDEDIMMDDVPQVTHPFLAGMSKNNADYYSSGTWWQPGASGSGASDLLANTTDEDMALLLGGLGDLHVVGDGHLSGQFAGGSSFLSHNNAGFTIGQQCDSPAQDFDFATNCSSPHVRDRSHWCSPAQPQAYHAPTPQLALGPNSTTLYGSDSPAAKSHAGTPARQRSIDRMPPPRLPPSRVQTPTSSPIAPLPRLTRRDTPHPFTPRTKTLTALLNRSPTPASSPSYSRASTRERVAQARAEARSSIPVHSLPRYQPPSEEEDSLATLQPTPLRVSLSLPDFLYGSTDPNEPHLQPPIRFEDTDIGLDASSPVQITQPQTIAREFGNVNILLDNTANFFQRLAPTLLELRMNALEHLNISTRKRRRAPKGSEPSHKQLVLDQRKVSAPMEYYILKEVVCTTPWPSDRDACLLSAVDYAVDMSRIADPEVYTPQFQDRIYSKTSANRGSSLTRVEFLVEHTFGISGAEKDRIMQLLRNDQVFFPTTERDPNQYFCVKLVGDVLEIIFFKSGKPLGLVFMEDLCKSDDPVKCAHWHKKLDDPTATKGVSPAAIAFAAAQIYWALEKMYLGTKLHFDEQHFRIVWDRYFRALLKLPHLKQLRLSLLDRLKLYYMDHWPADERDKDDNSFTAW